jgi:hypothetical protein
MAALQTLGRIAALAVMTATMAWAVTPITALGDRADLVVVGELLSVRGVGEGAAEMSVRLETVLKGLPPASSITAVLPASALMRQHRGRYDGEQVDAKHVFRTVDPFGLWFFQRASSGGYEVIPTEEMDYTENAAFIPLPRWWVPSPKDDLRQSILAALQVSCESAESPSIMRDGKLLVALEAADRDEALAIANELMMSSSSHQRLLGLAVAIRWSSEQALAHLAREFNTLRLDKDFSFLITFSLRNYYQPSGGSSIAALLQLIGLDSDGSRSLDVAVLKALQRIGTKEVLPEMVLLLDSPNPAVKAGACWYFHYFTALANPDGSIDQSGRGTGRRLYFTEETRIHTGQDSDTVDEDAEFWKSWWMEHREDLGFADSAGAQ